MEGKVNMNKIMEWWRSRGKFTKIYLIVGILITIGIIGSSMEVEGPDTDTKNQSQATNDNEGESEDSIDEGYYVGDRVMIGNVAYTINSIEITDKIGSQYLTSTAKDTYLIINVTITNNGNDLLTISDSFFQLQKGDKTYRATTSAILDDSLTFRGINPEVTLTGNILFDVTEQTATDSSLQLQIQTNHRGNQKEVVNLYRH
jgi:hypothetical protein